MARNSEQSIEDRLENFPERAQTRLVLAKTPKFLLQQLLALALTVAASAELAPEAAKHAILRGNLKASQFRFENEKKGHVAFLGGSITENAKGHTAMIPAWLKERFPETEFTFNNAGISSTCSTSGAFRLRDHVLSEGPVDLLIVEFAVNDDQDAMHARQEALRGMEGVIRHFKTANPAGDVVVIHYVNPEMLAKLEKGETPASSEAHEAVAKHYNVSSVDVGAALASGAMNWETYGGTHPKEAGYRLASDMVISVLEKAWSTPAGDALVDSDPLRAPLDEYSYDKGKFLNPNATDWMGGWETGKASKELLPIGAIRGRFSDWDLTVASEPGAQMTFYFQGRGIGAFVLAGPDAGILEASVDGSPFGAVDLYHHHSKGLNYPRTVMFFTELKPGFHQVTLRVAERPEGQEGGNRAAILHLVVNE